jgi:excinuclease ABC subunit C
MFDIEEQLKKLPQKPGVYLMKNASGEIIYVGKANSLRNRVRQYFQSSKNHPPKVKAMVSNIAAFEYIITDSEVEALILESNLIKKHKPKYNILLRDDKQYPYIKVTVMEKYPRVVKTRRVIKDGAKYFGPYIHAGAVNQTLEVLRKFYPIRTCNKNIENRKDRPCLNYHIHRCLGPCTGEVDPLEYMKMIDEIVLFLNGKQNVLIGEIELRMQKAAAEMNYEKAAEYRDQIMALRSILEKQKIVLNSKIDLDVMAMERHQDDVCMMVFFVRNGQLMGREHYMLNTSWQDDPGEVLSSFLKQFYRGTAFVPKEILLQYPIEDSELIAYWLSTKKGSKVKIKTPQKGEKKELLDMVYKNAVEALEQWYDQLKREQEKSEGAVKTLGAYLKLKKIPNRIEAFDISNTQGVYSVASMVVFEAGKPKYSDYRRFRIHTVEGANDYGSMQEVLYRRFKKGIEEKKRMKAKGIIDEEDKFYKFPDLILIDGGIGQVNAALDVLHALNLDIPIAGMVKDTKHKTKDLIYHGQELKIRTDFNLFQLISRIQEEAHRFAIAYHKSLRGKTMVQSVLDQIPQVGPKRKRALLKHFGNIEKIKAATLDELSEVEGMNKKVAKQIYDFFMHKNTRER